MYKRILIPTDGSPEGELAVRHGLKLTKAVSARATILHVLDPSASPQIDPVGLPIGGEVSSTARIEGQAILDRAVALAREVGVEAETRLRSGAPVQTILEEIPQHDLVVMGSHGRSGLSRLLIGSVTEGVLHRSPVPVLTVRVKGSS
jgi:nucleotide-binding universal stress UspA family protein